jgi:hypothetical protein
MRLAHTFSKNAWLLLFIVFLPFSFFLLSCSLSLLETLHQARHQQERWTSGGSSSAPILGKASPVSLSGRRVARFT